MARSFEAGWAKLPFPGQLFTGGAKPHGDREERWHTIVETVLRLLLRKVKLSPRSTERLRLTDKRWRYPTPRGEGQRLAKQPKRWKPTLAQIAEVLLDRRWGDE